VHAIDAGNSALRTVLFCALMMLGVTAQAAPQKGQITAEGMPVCKQLFKAAELVQYISDGDQVTLKQALTDYLKSGDCSVVDKGQMVYVDDSDEEQGFAFLSIHLPGQSTHWWIITSAVQCDTRRPAPGNCSRSPSRAGSGSSS
jgi:hypothetical protein